MDLKRIPETPGVYIYRNKTKEIIYIGKAINLKHRVNSYFQKNILSPRTSQMVSQIDSIQTIKTASEFDALILEAKLIRENQPKYNVESRDDKHPLYIAITKEEFPKIKTVRKSAVKGLECFGPFPSSRVVRDTLRYLRRIFPYCTENRVGKKVCFYSHLGLCNPCPNHITKLNAPEYKQQKNEYRKNIGYIRRILRGHSQNVLKYLQKQMMSFSENEEFEQANRLKKQLERLTYLTSERYSISEYLKNPNLYADIRKQECDSLAELLQLPEIRKIEGYDISNTMGKEAVGRMTVF